MLMLSQIPSRLALAAGLVAVAGLSGCSAGSGSYCHDCSPRPQHSMLTPYGITPHGSYGYSAPAEHGYNYGHGHPTPVPPSGTYYHQAPVYTAPQEPAPAPPAVDPVPDSVSTTTRQTMFRTPRFLKPVSNRVRDLVDRFRD